MTPARRLQILLRISAFVTGLAIFPTFMPRHWMAITHQALQLGPFPDGPIVEYLARSLSAFYAIHGGLYWLVSRDTTRYSPVISYLAILGLLFAFTVLYIDLHAGMPLRWTICEPTVVCALSIAILILQRQANSSSR